MIICLVCGAENAPKTNACSSCGANLPKMDYSTSTATATGGRVTERFDQFQQACHKVKMGEWNQEEFSTWLQVIHNTLTEKANGYVSHIQDSGYFEYQMEEVEMSFTGLEDYENGMQHLWQYTETGDVSHLDQGLQLIWEGNEKINESMRLNRQFRRGLEEEWGYM